MKKCFFVKNKIILVKQIIISLPQPASKNALVTTNSTSLILLIIMLCFIYKIIMVVYDLSSPI